jgi:type II secretory pathway predicted ATPase ExeA
MQSAAPAASLPARAKNVNGIVSVIGRLNPAHLPEAGFKPLPIQDDSAPSSLSTRRWPFCAQRPFLRKSQVMRTTNPKIDPTLRQLAERDERVFSSYPQVGRYYPSAAMEDARKRLGRAIERGDGPGLVIGAPGTGKSLLLQVLAAQYHDRFDVVLLACARLCTRRALLQSVLFELGLPYKIRDEGELRLGLLDHLLSATDCPSALLLLVDEAQSLPVALLDELRVMTNLVRGDRPRVRLVLAGSSALEESFAQADLESFSQRLSARCYLAPFGREETRQFIRAQLAAANARPDEICTRDAWDAVFDATDGIPRLVSQLCDRALELGAAGSRTKIDCELIQRAWSDLQQLPAPGHESHAVAEKSPVSQVVEFGGLSEDISDDDESSERAITDIEPTELDIDESSPQVWTNNTGLEHKELAATAAVADPFAEKFDEEEVVLDNFAAWDDVFRREMPRVENRRDPGFATLVQSAIEALPELFSYRTDTASLSVMPDDEFNSVESPAVVGEPTEDTCQGRPCDSLKVMSDTQSLAAPIQPDGSRWPPLKLAVVSEPAPLTPIPLLPPSKPMDEICAAFGNLLTTLEINRGHNRKSAVESPMLVVEEDSPPGSDNSPVRRKSYRHLFSRLRSG